VLETDLLQKRTEKKIAQGILNRLRDELDNLKEEVTKTELEIEGLSEERVWLDWVQKFGEDLQYKMSDPENHASWVKGLIDKIVVKTAMGEDRDGNRKQVGHKFNVYFKMKVVRDKLAYLDPDNKGLGYEVREGRSKSSSKVVNLSRSRGKKKDLSDRFKYNHRSETLGDRGVVSNVRVPEVEYYLCFTATLTSSRLSNPAPYSNYQSELHDLIQRLHDEGMGYRRIAQWLNENGYQTPRGKRFFNTHVFSILKKKRIRDERRYPERYLRCSSSGS